MKVVKKKSVLRTDVINDQQESSSAQLNRREIVQRGMSRWM